MVTIYKPGMHFPLDKYLKGAGLGKLSTLVQYPLLEDRVNIHMQSGVSFDAYTEVVTGSGVIYQALMAYAINTGTTVNSTGRSYYTQDTYDLRAHLDGHWTIFKLKISEITNQELWAIMAQHGTTFPGDVDKKAGFRIVDDKLYAHCANGATKTQTEILTLSGNDVLLCVMVGISATSIQFYVDGVLKTTISTNLVNDKARFMMAAENTAAAAKSIKVSNFAVIGVM